MKLFDSHSHIDDSCYDADFDEMIRRAGAEGIVKIMVVGINPETTRKAIQLAGKYSSLITSVGLHPHDAKTVTAEMIESFKTLARENDCVRAWGETGLDFNRMHSPAAMQEKCFMMQLEAADELDLPLIFHERDSEGRFYDILREYHPRRRSGVVHCFSGTREDLFSYLDLGYHIGITGILTIKNRGEMLRKLAPLIPENRLVIETDAPWLTPSPQRNKFRRNEPAFVRSVLTVLADVRNTPPEVLAERIWQNTHDLFRLDAD